MTQDKNMRKISVFNHVTVDGFFAGPKGEIDWFKVIPKDEEWDKYTHTRSQSGPTLIFGHTTYELMKSFWPTPIGIRSDPDMARVMNSSPKIVFSKKLRRVKEGPHWKNIRLFPDIRPEEIRQLKEKEDMLILGSGAVVRQFANLGLIDEYNLVVVPLVLGTGKPLFKGVKQANLKLLEVKAFKNGIALLRYQPIK
jgi:dihydrofolate reductase